MKSPISKMRAAALVVLCALSISFTSNAMAEGSASLAEQIATAVAAGIMSSSLSPEAKADALAGVAAAAAAATPEAAAAIAAAVAAQNPAAAAAIAAAVAAQNPAAASAIAAAVSAQNPEAAAAIAAAVDASVSDPNAGNGTTGDGVSESNIYNSGIKINTIIGNLENTLNSCTNEQCRIDAAVAAAQLIGSDPATSVALAATIANEVPAAAAQVGQIIAASNTDLATDISSAVSPN